MELLGREGQTICAPITAMGTAGIAVLRISGPRALEITRVICPFLPQLPESHHVYYGLAKEPQSGELLDEVLCTYFAEGRSFTGEESLEISCHGNPIIVRELMIAMTSLGALSALRGEFTFKAYMNGRIDLIQAESVLGLVHGRSERATKMALRQLQGGLSRQVIKIEDNLTWVLANIEAGIDFSTEDIDVLAHEEIRRRITMSTELMESLLAGFRKVRPILRGFRVAIMGRPNAGKSSLLNALLNEERAIVTDLPGTTRDLIAAELGLSAGVITLVDSAGLRETNDPVEKIGVLSARKLPSDVDLIVYLVDSSVGVVDEDLEFLRSLAKKDFVVIFSKSDVVSLASSTAEFIKTLGPKAILTLSSQTKNGLETLISYFEQELESHFVEDQGVVTQERQAELLQRAGSRSRKALELLQGGASLEFVALELQDALLAVFELMGKRFDDQVMDRVFREFCIGK